MEPVFAPRVAEIRFALCNLVRVVRKRVINAAAVNVEVFAEVLDADAAALDVPARVAHAPRGIPFELLVVKLRLCKPQYEVALGALVFVLFHAVTHAYGEALFLHVAENIIVFELGGIKIDVAARDIRISLFKEHLYHVDERIDAARRRNDDLRALDAKFFAVTEKCVGIELRNLHDGLVLAARALEHLVFAGVGIAGKVADVRDVHGAGHVIAEVAQGFFQHILHDV